ncbi:uncharacterized protein LOC129577176 [Sitodiplosis mosellana]|uniref:uncharacterized protein LOC129577176 n=1 Tax=Sitodiplosis mosellana TaxID=263140 RepID=UPI002443BDFF|nr:uncharacterized protein LOC129577176 [Sitodiplosis mosellana]
MDSFFGNIVKAKFNSREHQIKQSLIDTLSDNAKEIQYELKEGANDEMCEQLYLSDHTQSLCATIEAIFLHGLKDSFLWQTVNILVGTGGEANRRPSPTFWAPLMIFSHKYAIEQIHSMTQITTEIGYCRCWIRQSLNDCLLSSYFSNMRKSSQTLAPYYQRTAFLRDSDFMELAESLIGGLEACVSFDLPLNSSLLNTWTDLPLQLSGLYTPSLQSYPIASGIDVANNTGVLYTSVSPAKIAADKPMHELVAEDRNIPIPKPLQTNEFFSASIHNSPFKESAIPNLKATFIKPYVSVEEVEEPTSVDVGVDCFEAIDDDIEHDVQLTALLTRVDAMVTKRDSPEPSNSGVANLQSEMSEAEKRLSALMTANDADEQIIIETEETNPFSSASPIMGNSLVSRMGWSSTDDNELEIAAKANEESTTPVQSMSRSLSRSNSLNSSIKSPIDRFSYNSLLRRGVKRAQDGDECFSRQIDYNDVWQRFESTLGIAHTNAVSNDAAETKSQKSADKPDESGDEDALVDFEFVQSDSLAHFSMPELREMVQQTFKIPRESGLDSQNFACLSCGNPLGVGGSGVTTTQVCGFNGAYYCSGCMATDPFQIPARVIFNWDFKKYPVSQKAAAFLQEFQHQSFIDLKILNPDIYQYVDEMAELQSLRIQLNFIRAYLFTCCAPIIEKLRKQLWTKEYLYEHIHRYTFADLQRIPKKLLADQLRKVVAFGRQHILECPLCSQKGFICEICQSNKVLYPFDIDTTYKCDDCSAVFHAECLNALHPCPKCERRRKREDLPLLDVIHQTADATEEFVSKENEHLLP